METTTCPRSKKHNIGVRLLRKEMDEVKKGFSRYTGRILAVARDIHPSRGNSISKIIRLEKDMLQVLSELGQRINRHE